MEGTYTRMRTPHEPSPEKHNRARIKLAWCNKCMNCTGMCGIAAQRQLAVCQHALLLFSSSCTWEPVIMAYLPARKLLQAVSCHSFTLLGEPGELQYRVDVQAAHHRYGALRDLSACHDPCAALQRTPRMCTELFMSHAWTWPVAISRCQCALAGCKRRKRILNHTWSTTSLQDSYQGPRRYR
jgi:hypothetical protein